MQICMSPAGSAASGARAVCASAAPGGEPGVPPGPSPGGAPGVQPDTQTGQQSFCACAVFVPRKAAHILAMKRVLLRMRIICTQEDSAYLSYEEDQGANYVDRNWAIA